MTCWVKNFKNNTLRWNEKTAIVFRPINLVLIHSIVKWSVTILESGVTTIALNSLVLCEPSEPRLTDTVAVSRCVFSFAAAVWYPVITELITCTIPVEVTVLNCWRNDSHHNCLAVWISCDFVGTGNVIGVLRHTDGTISAIVCGRKCTTGARKIIRAVADNSAIGEPSPIVGLVTIFGHFSGNAGQKSWSQSYQKLHFCVLLSKHYGQICNDASIYFSNGHLVSTTYKTACCLEINQLGMEDNVQTRRNLAGYCVAVYWPNASKATGGTAYINVANFEICTK